MSNFKELSKINVNEHTEKKNGLTYLSWAWAVDQLLQNDPTATWTYGQPVAFGDTLMVFCSVTAFGKTMTAQLPVIDFRNKAISNPDAMAVNTAMQRCLAKAIALHGIGLYIYAGEDLPEEDKVQAPQKVTPNAGALDGFNREETDIIHEMASHFASSVLTDENMTDAKEIWASLDNEQKTALWSLLASGIRSKFKKGK